jgi:hypothetical protein
VILVDWPTTSCAELIDSGFAEIKGCKAGMGFVLPGLGFTLIAVLEKVSVVDSGEVATKGTRVFVPRLQRSAEGHGDTNEEYRSANQEQAEGGIDHWVLL